MKQLRAWWHAFEELIFPSSGTCGLCKEQPALPVGACKNCLDCLAIRWHKQKIQGYPCFSLFPYQGIGRDLIHRLKFQSDYEVACTFGYFLGLAAREEPELTQVQILVPVPLSLERFRQRGFNQARILADTMGRAWKKPVGEQVARTRETKPQSELSALDRKHNLRGAFAVLPGFDVRGKHCLIVDDIITSGQTFLALAQLVEDYGGRPMGLFLARTEKFDQIRE